MVDGWRIWTVDMLYGKKSWSASPPNGPIAVVTADSLLELELDIAAWEARTDTEIDAHIAHLRHLHDLPGQSGHTQKFLDARIAAEGRIDVGARKTR